MSSDGLLAKRQNMYHINEEPVYMSTKKKISHTATIKAFKARLRMARMASGLSQKQIADELGILENTYSKYENRNKSMLPGHLIVPFCDASGCDIIFLLSSKGARPVFAKESANTGEAA